MVDKYVIITTTDIKGNITYASEAFCKISGYKLNDIIRKKFTQVCNKNMEDSFNEYNAYNSWDDGRTFKLKK